MKYRTNKIFFKKAFTLAETLLVMVMIGIIASILIASIGPYNATQKGFEGLASKAQGDIEQTFNRIIISDADYDGISVLKDSAGSFKITDEGVLDRFVAIVQKYIQNNGKIVDKTKEADYFSAELLNYDKTKTGVKLEDTFSNFYFGNNGVLWGFKLNGNCTTTETLEYLYERTAATSVENTCGAFFVDVNGYKKPNKLGSDQYILPFDEKFMKYI